MARIYVVFYSTYGHVHTLANAVAEGLREVAAAPKSRCGRCRN